MRNKHWPLQTFGSDGLPLDSTRLISNDLLEPVGKGADASKQIERSGQDKLPAATGQDLTNHGISDDFGIDQTAKTLLDDSLVDTEQRGSNPGRMDRCSVHIWCFVEMLELLRQACHTRMPPFTKKVVSIVLGCQAHDQSTQSSAL